MAAHEPKFVVFEDNADEFRWHLKAGNGKIIADSGEGYVSHQGAVNAAFRFKKIADSAKVVTEVPKHRQK